MCVRLLVRVNEILNQQSSSSTTNQQLTNSRLFNTEACNSSCACKLPSTVLKTTPGAAIKGSEPLFGNAVIGNSALDFREDLVTPTGASEEGTVKESNSDRSPGSETDRPSWRCCCCCCSTSDDRAEITGEVSKALATSGGGVPSDEALNESKVWIVPLPRIVSVGGEASL